MDVGLREVKNWEMGVVQKNRKPRCVVRYTVQVQVHMVRCTVHIHTYIEKFDLNYQNVIVIVWVNIYLSTIDMI